MRYQNVYNFAVTLLLIALVGTLIDRARLGIFLGTSVAIVTFVIWWCGWGRDLCALLHKKNRQRLREDYELDVVPRD